MQFPRVQFLAAAAAANYQQIFVSPHAAVLRRDNKSLFWGKQTVTVAGAASSGAAAQNRAELQRNRAPQKQRKVFISVGALGVLKDILRTSPLRHLLSSWSSSSCHWKLSAVELNGVTTKIRLGGFTRAWEDNPPGSYQRKTMYVNCLFVDF